MAGQPSIVVRIAANVREFLKGTDQVETALDDLSQESSDLARDVGSDTDKMGRSFDDLGDKSSTLARDVGSDTDKMEKAFRDAAASIKTSSRKAGKAVDTEFGQASSDAGKEAGKETGQEFAANLSESLASGDLKSIGSDTAAGLVAGFAGMGGPIGYGLALAAVPITAFFLNIRKQAEETKENVGSIFALLKESAGKLNEEFLRSRFDEIWNADPSKWREIRDLLDDAGLSTGTIRDAIVGTDAATKVVAKRYDELNAAALRAGQLALTVTGAESDRYRAIEQAAQAQADAAAEVLKQNGYLKDGRTEYEAYASTRETGLETERKRTAELDKQLKTLQALNREATAGSPASFRIQEEMDRNRRSRPGGGRRTP